MNTNDFTVGKIFGAAYDDGVPLMCITTEVDQDKIQSWVVNGQYEISFDKTSGRSCSTYFPQGCNASLYYTEDLLDQEKDAVMAIQNRLAEHGSSAGTYYTKEDDRVLKELFTKMGIGENRDLSEEVLPRI